MNMLRNTYQTIYKTRELEAFLITFFANLRYFSVKINLQVNFFQVAGANTDFKKRPMSAISCGCTLCGMG